MYKVWHKLFGWDYIYWSNFAAQGVARVHVNLDGDVWYWRYKNIKLIDKIDKSDQVIWLTCNSYEYIDD